jgi:hypothetical protein
MIRYCIKLLCCALFFNSQIVSAQFTDNFSDGDFTNNPTWSGDDINFSVQNEILRLTAPAVADQMYLSTANEAIENAQWEFWVQLTFNPSSTNYANVYLVSNQANLKGSLNGYFVRIGNTADEVSLYRQTGTTVTEIIDGVDGFVNMDPVIVRVRVTRDAVGNWELFADNTGGTNYQLMGSVFDNTYIQSNYAGVHCVYTQTRSDRFYYDDFVVTGDPFVDNIPPVVENVTVLSANQLQVNFSEPVLTAQAENIQNYDVMPFFGTPESAVQNTLNPSEVTLTFAQSFQNGNTYNLLAGNISDLSGNEMESQLIPFLYFIPDVAEFKQVVFNELMADPTPVVQLPDAEFVELYNPSSGFFDLGGWHFVNTTTVRVLPSFALAPGAYVLLCHINDVALFEPFGDVIGIPSFVALTNSADSLTLISPEGEIIDWVSYKDSWYQDAVKKNGGWTLELINPETECSGAQNWIASNNETGGTPGAINSVYNNSPDVEPPQLINYTLNSPQSVTLTFNEPLDPESMSNAVFELSPSNAVIDFALSANFESITVELLAPIDTAIYYTLSITGITDCPGNVIGDQNSIQFVIGYIPALHEIVINEIMADPTPTVGLPNAEYIEIHNLTDKLFDLSGGRISTATFQPNTFIQPNGYLILVGTANELAYESFDNVALMNSMGTTFLTNGGRELYFANRFDDLVDRVEYSDSWYRDDSKTDGGWSLEKINPEEPCRGGDNWQASIAISGGTPGEANSVLNLNPDQRAPLLDVILVYDASIIELVFDEVLDAASVDAATYTFSPTLQLASVEIMQPGLSRVLITFVEPMVENLRYEVTINGLLDCTGNEFVNIGEAVFALPVEPTEGNLIINEILFNQRTGGFDFVEIYNNSDATMSLQNWKLGNLDNNQYYAITTEPYIIFPGEYLAITRSKNNILTEYPLSVAKRIFQASNIPTYNNGSGKAVLVHPNDDIIDRFDYDEKMHFALLTDVKGVSLERIDFNRPSNDATNWTSAAQTVGWATPGYENSQRFMSNEPFGEVSVDPELFSPDNDGYQDIMNINYKFERGDLVGNITIHDSAGRPFRRLMRSELLGNQGTVSWDGIGDTQERARMGIYIVYFEVFDPAGLVKSYKLSCVVASRM